MVGAIGSFTAAAQLAQNSVAPASADVETLFRVGYQDCGIAFLEAQSETLKAVNREILTLQEQGYLRMIAQKWFGEEENL